MRCAGGGRAVGPPCLLNRSPNARSRSDEYLGDKVKASFMASDRTYGARRVGCDVLADGADCGPAPDRTADAPAGIARTAAQEAVAERQRRSTARDGAGEPAGPAVCCRAAEPEVDRRLHLSLDDRLAAVIDLFSRRVVGWSMSATMTAQLVTDALLMAVWRRENRMRCCITPTRAASTPASRSIAL